MEKQIILNISSNFLPLILLILVLWSFKNIEKIEKEFNSFDDQGENFLRVIIQLLIGNKKIKKKLLKSDCNTEGVIDSIIKNTRKIVSAISLYYLVGVGFQLWCTWQSIKVYSYLSIEMLENNEQWNMLGMMIGSNLFMFVTFWIFYGQAIFKVFGIKYEEKISDIVYKIYWFPDYLIKRLQPVIIRVSVRICIFIVCGILLRIYIMKFLPYISLVIIQVFNLGNLLDINTEMIFLIPYIILIQIYQQYIVKILIFIVSFSFTFLKASKGSTIKSIVSELKSKKYFNYILSQIHSKFKNTTYLFMVFVYIYSVVNSNNDNIIIHAFAMSFLIDTYLINEKQLEDEIEQSGNSQ